ncbi:diguanylate cyclase [Agaribacterium haliotis]|uniref:diguanylate cyclase n=1 Tax=Agaribacterium haliotis TaxID=2013869 RepID=UPI000BB555E5|nr:diguanylate cyclase [Agaribacterium haliotis]
MKAYICALFLAFFSSQSLAQRSIDINIPQTNNDRDRLVVELLGRIFEAQDYRANFIEATEFLSDSRQTEELRSGRLDIIWAGMSEDREEILLPVRVPIFKGIQGHRIFSIRPESQSAFAMVKNLDDLKRFEAGSGMGWGDTVIIEAAGLPTVTTSKGVNLWPMLDGARFDYFPLAIHEPWSEIRSRTDLNLTVEKHLLLVYPFAMYFYVNAEDQKLRNILHSGMNAMLDDGSYDRFLFSAPMFKDALIDADVSQRTVIRIPNPFMHPATPVNETKYWLDPKKLTIEDLQAL